VNRDSGLEEAIRAVGGVGALARALGIAQPSVSNWRRIPAERVLAVESLTGVRRTVLRPDLYPDHHEFGAAMTDDDVDAARSREYALLGALLLRAPDAQTLTRLARIQATPTPLGLAHVALAEAAEAMSAEAVRHEFFDLFIGVGRGELLPYASYYLTGFLHDRPLARLREDLARLGLARAEDNPDPEDHIGTLFEVMSGFAAGGFEAPSGEESRFFASHIAPWAARFFADLEIARAARFYRPVAVIGRMFLDIEMEGFALESGRSG
jgi:TorA maturation chaperone TorD